MYSLVDEQEQSTVGWHSPVQIIWIGRPLLFSYYPGWFPGRRISQTIWMDRKIPPCILKPCEARTVPTQRGGWSLHLQERAPLWLSAWWVTNREAPLRLRTQGRAPECNAPLTREPLVRSWLSFYVSHLLFSQHIWCPTRYQALL